jgi:hypothetical protein
MIYWIMSAFLGLMVTMNIPGHDPAGQQQQESELSLRASQTVCYINEINDWRYLNPTQKDGIIPDSSLGWPSIPDLHNVLQAGRVYVWQPNAPGLMSALLAQSRQTALVGRVVSGRLIDSAGNDMQVTVPPGIADGSLVYLN